MNVTAFKAGAKAALLLLVNEAEEQIVGEKMGPQRKAWVHDKVKAFLKNAGLYGKKLFGVFSIDAAIDAALSAAIDWAALKLKSGFDILEKL